MKKYLLLIISFFIVHNNSFSQITPLPVDLTHTNAAIKYISLPSQNVIWGGCVGQIGSDYTNSKVYVRSTDAGATWIVDSIPSSGANGFACMHAYDENVMWAGLSDVNGVGGGSVWKTIDGGSSWNEMTTNQFAGGYLDVIYFNTLDSGVAIGDSAYKFEIYTTIDGGTTWNRVPQSTLPVPSGNEYIVGNLFSVHGNRLSVSTNYGKFLYSDDMGYTWHSVNVGPGNYINFQMSDALNGIGYVIGFSTVYVTNNGGLTWTTRMVSPAVPVYYANAIKDVPGSFIFKSRENLYVTTDYFTTCYQIYQSDLPFYAPVQMFDATLGYTADSLYSDSSLIKIENAFSKIEKPGSNFEKFSVFPNPVVSENALASFTLKKSSAVNISIIDQSGKIISRQFLQGEAGKNVVRLDCSSLSSGNYFVNIQDDAGNTDLKIVVQ